MKKNLSKDEILAVFDSVNNLAKLKKDIQKFIMNKKNLFEDRLVVFVNTPTSLQSSDSWILHLEEFEDKHGTINWFDDFYGHRHEEIDLTGIIDDKENYCEEWSDEKFRAFQEAVLDNGAHSFTLDW